MSRRNHTREPPQRDDGVRGPVARAIPALAVGLLFAAISVGTADDSSVPGDPARATPETRSEKTTMEPQGKPADLASTDTLVLFDFSKPETGRAWEVVNDGVMGGLSDSTLGTEKSGLGVFSGRVSLDNNGGFASTRSRPIAQDLGAYEGLEVRVKGDGKRYKLTLKRDGRLDGVLYQAPFTTVVGDWVTFRIGFREFVPTFRGRILTEEPRIAGTQVRVVGFLISDKQEGPFHLEIASIRAYR